MKASSIRFRLTAWYAGVFLLVWAGFGTFTYMSLQRYLRSALEESLRRRAHQIGTSLLLSAEKTGESFVVDQIRSLYGPELNNRFIRISRQDGSLLYVSGTPNDMSFEPARVPRVTVGAGETKVTALTSERLLLLSVPYAVQGSPYLVEVGASTLEGENLLRSFLLNLALGLLVVMALTAGGGSLLIKRALGPVRSVTDAAREITFHNLARRLPVERTGDEIEHLSFALNAMIERLDESFQHASRFTADASHELRTPLTVIRGELESVIQEASLEPNIRTRLGTVLEETERLAKIVEDLFAMCRLEAGDALLERTRFDLANLVVTTAGQMSLLADDKNIRVDYLGDELVEVEGDPARLKQVVVNLLDNAIKFSPVGGRISLATHRLDGQAILEVTDNGPGIPEGELPRVFDRFYRVGSSRGSSGGAGLGLAIVRLICSAHGGTASVGNVPEGGCRVRVSVPLAKPQEDNGLGRARAEGPMAFAR